MKKKQKKTPVRGKLDKVSHIQPRYKLDENINHVNERDLMENQSRLMELLSNSPVDEPKVFKGTLGQNFLNITP